jgi:hypothetical protein
VPLDIERIKYELNRVHSWEARLTVKDISDGVGREDARASCYLFVCEVFGGTKLAEFHAPRFKFFSFQGNLLSN